MKLGIESYSYHRYFGEVYPTESPPDAIWSLADFSEHIQCLPLEVIGLETRFLPKDDEPIREFCRMIGCPVVFAWGHPNGFMGVSEATALSEIQRYLRLSALVGSKILRIVISSSAHFSEPHQPQLNMAIDRLTKLLPLAEKLQVQMAIENHSDLYLEEIIAIANHFASPFLGLALDTGNALRRGEDPIAAAKEYASQLKIVYVKDVREIDGRLLCVPAGQGQTNLRGLFGVLAHVAFTGPCLVELDAVHPDYSSRSETELLADSITFLNTLRNELPTRE